jgi:protein phosphatase PTC7
LFLDTAPVFYKLRITTGDLRGAGTTEQVMIQLHGDSGSSGRHVIQAPLNRAETVEVVCEVHGELGRLQRMEVGFVDPESALQVKGSGWLLDRIETYRIDNSMRHMPKPVIFPCQRWIGESESGSRSGGPLQTLFPLAMELTVPRTPSKAAGASSADITMCAVAAGVPHPDKVAKGVKGFISKEFGYAGEDAYLVLCQGPVQVLAIADGVASWWQKGIDAGEYSRTLVNCVKQAAFQALPPDSEDHEGANSADASRVASSSTSASSSSSTPKGRGERDEYNRGGQGGDEWALDPKRLLASGWELLKKNTVLGSCTACVVSLDRSSGRLRVANLGDSGLMIVRVMHFEHERSLVSRLALGLLAKELRKMDLVEDHLHGKFDDGGKRLVTGQATGQAPSSGPSGSLAYDEMLLTNTLKASNGKVGVRFQVIFRTPPLEHNLGHPKQLGHHPNTDNPEDADCTEVEVRDGDFLVMGTDGLFDNLGEHEIAHRIVQSYLMMSAEGHTARSASGTAARALVSDAFKMSTSKDAVTPFSIAASEELNLVYSGGKLDDITVLVGVVEQGAVSDGRLPSETSRPPFVP